MIAALLFLSALVFIPGAGPLVDAYDQPKTVIVGALAVMVWIDFYLRTRDGKKLSFPLAGLIAIFLSLSSIGTILSLSKGSALNIHYFLYALGAQLASFSFFFYGINSRLLPHASCLLLAPVVIVAAYALTPWLGITTTFGNQERGSALVALAAGIALAQMAKGERRIAKIGSTATLALLLLFLWQAQMRSALIGLGIGLIVWLAFGIPARKIAAALIAIAVFAAYFHPNLIAYFNLDGGRPAMWQEALGLDWWPFGIGLGQWRLHAQALVHEPDINAYYWRELHNDYIQLLIETGPLALGAWGYLLYRILAGDNRQQATGNSKSALVIGLIAVLVNAVFLFPFQLPIEAAWFWLMAGIYRREA